MGLLFLVFVVDDSAN